MEDKVVLSMRKRAMKTIFILAMGYIVLVLMSTYSFSYSFKGRVVDAGTKEPIEGAAVVAYWYKEEAFIIESSFLLKDVKEALTDKNGAWTIEGPKGRGHSLFLLLLSHLPFVHVTREPEFIIFKPGYCSWPNGFGIGACKGELKPGGNNKIREGETVELPRLTERGDRKMVLPGIVKGDIGAKRKQIAKRKQKTYIKLLNEERRYLGVDEYRYDFLKEENK
jgi:hypothetical protein